MALGPVAGPPLVEAYAVEDVFCSGLAVIEDVSDGCARFVLYVDQIAYPINEPVRIIKLRVVLPMEAIRPGVELTLAYLARRAAHIAGKAILSLVGR